MKTSSGPSTMSYAAIGRPRLQRGRRTLEQAVSEEGYMPEGAARAYLRDLPHAELQLIAGAGHWLLETHFDRALPLIRDFLSRAHAG